MKKTVLTSLFLIMSAASSTVLANQQNLMPNMNNVGGFSGPTSAQMPNSVRAVLDSRHYGDDFPVTLTGVITRSLGGEMYQFRDSTGEIMVEIDHDEWFGLQVSPTTQVIIDGEIDRDFQGTSIEVKRIRAK